MVRRTIPKHIRQQVYEKCNGHCAYCGCELAAVLREYGFDARRGQQYCGANGDADVVGLPGVHIECKRVEKLNIDNAIEQAISDSKNNEMPAVFHRKNRKKMACNNKFGRFHEVIQGEGK